MGVLEERGGVGVKERGMQSWGVNEAKRREIRLKREE